MKNFPKVTLVGAGPGDPDLITIKGVKALQAANVVLYDALVDPELLRYAPGATCIPVGKRAGKSSVSQAAINRLIVEKAITCGHVVRLKGGDPFVFGRGFEEVQYARRFGVETEVVVGISSIQLAGSYGIPLTSRGVNQSFTALTATTATGALSKEVKLAARYSNTSIVFMGLGKLDQIVDLYKAEGRGALPVAIISKGSCSSDELLTGTVNTILENKENSTIKAPALLIFGEGAAHASENLYVGEERPHEEVVA